MDPLALSSKDQIIHRARSPILRPRAGTMSVVKQELAEIENHLFLNDQDRTKLEAPRNPGVQPLKFGQNSWVNAPDADLAPHPRTQKRSESFNVQVTDRSIDSPIYSQGKATKLKWSYKKDSRNSLSTQAFDNLAQVRSQRQQFLDPDTFLVEEPLGYCKTLDGLLFTSKTPANSSSDCDEHHFQLFYSWEQNFVCHLGGLEYPCVLMFFPSGGFFFGKVDKSNVADGPGLLRLPLLKTDVLGTWKKGRICGKAWVKTDNSTQICGIFQGNRLQSYITEATPTSDEFLFEQPMGESGRFSIFTSTPPKDRAEDQSPGRRELTSAESESLSFKSLLRSLSPFSNFVPLAKEKNFLGCVDRLTGKKDGVGAVFKRDGSLFIGVFCQGAMRGLGISLDPKLNSQIGWFQEGRIHGFSNCYLHGDRYTGLMHNGHYSGHGTYFRQSDNVWVTSVFTDGMIDTILCKETGKVDKQICLLGYKGELLPFLCPSLKDARSIQDEYLPHPVIEDQKVTLDFSENLTAATLLQSLSHMDQNNEEGTAILSKPFSSETYPPGLERTSNHPEYTLAMNSTAAIRMHVQPELSQQTVKASGHSPALDNQNSSWLTHSNLTFQEPHHQDEAEDETPEPTKPISSRAQMGPDQPTTPVRHLLNPRVHDPFSNPKPTANDDPNTGNNDHSNHISTNHHNDQQQQQQGRLTITLQKRAFAPPPRLLDGPSRHPTPSHRERPARAHVDFPKRPVRRVCVAVEVLEVPAAVSRPAAVSDFSVCAGSRVTKKSMRSRVCRKLPEGEGVETPSPYCDSGVWKGLLQTERTCSEVRVEPRNVLLRTDEVGLLARNEVLDTRLVATRKPELGSNKYPMEDFVLRRPVSVHLSAEESEKMSEAMSIDSRRAFIQAECTELDPALFGSAAGEVDYELRSLYGPSSRNIMDAPQPIAIGIKDSPKGKRGSLDGLGMQIHHLNMSRIRASPLIQVTSEEQKCNIDYLPVNEIINNSNSSRNKDSEQFETEMESLMVIPPNMRKFSDWTGYDMNGLEDFRRPSSTTTIEGQHVSKASESPLNDPPQKSSHPMKQESKPINCLLTPLLEYKPRNAQDPQLPTTNQLAPVETPKDFRRQQWGSQENISSPGLKPAKPRLLSFQTYIGLDEGMPCDYFEKEEKKHEPTPVRMPQKPTPIEIVPPVQQTSVLNIDPAKSVIDHHPEPKAYKVRKREEYTALANKQQFTADQWLRWIEHQKVNRAQQELREFDSADSNYNSDYFYEKCPELFAHSRPVEREVRTKKYTPGQLPGLDFTRLQSGSNITPKKDL